MKEKYHFSKEVQLSSEFSPKEIKKLFAGTRIDSCAFYSYQSDVIDFAYNRSGGYDWSGLGQFDHSRPAYTQITSIIKGRIVRLEGKKCRVEMKFNSKLGYIYIIPVFPPLIVFFASGGEPLAFFLFIPFALALGILTIIFYARTRRYLRMFCKVLEQ